jgi:hypothetical protein
MKLLLRSLLILLAGIAVALAFVPLGSTAWAENIRARRGSRGRPPVANLETPARPSGPAGSTAPARSTDAAPQRGRGQAGGPSGRVGRGGNPGLFSHFRGDQPFASDVLRFTQITVLQIAVPAGLTMAVLAIARRNRTTT